MLEDICVLVIYRENSNNAPREFCDFEKYRSYKLVIWIGYIQSNRTSYEKSGKMDCYNKSVYVKYKSYPFNNNI